MVEATVAARAAAATVVVTMAAAAAAMEAVETGSAAYAARVEATRV